MMDFLRQRWNYQLYFFLVVTGQIFQNYRPKWAGITHLDETGQLTFYAAPWWWLSDKIRLHLAMLNLLRCDQLPPIKFMCNLTNISGGEIV